MVFRAMIEPEQLTHFWGPTGTHTPLEGIVDRALGRRSLRDDDGATTRPADAGYPMKAVFVEVVEPERIVFTEPDVEGT